MTAYKDADICPNCRTKTRKKGRKNSNREKAQNRELKIPKITSPIKFVSLIVLNSRSFRCCRTRGC